MKKMIRLLVAFTLISGIAYATGNSNKAFPVVNLSVNGQSIPGEVPAINFYGNVMVPLSTVSKAIGADVDWDGKTNTASLEHVNPIQYVAFFEKKVEEYLKQQKVPVPSYIVNIDSGKVAIRASYHAPLDPNLSSSMTAIAKIAVTSALLKYKHEGIIIDVYNADGSQKAFTITARQADAVKFANKEINLQEFVETWKKEIPVKSEKSPQSPKPAQAASPEPKPKPKPKTAAVTINPVQPKQTKPAEPPKQPKQETAKAAPHPETTSPTSPSDHSLIEPCKDVPASQVIPAPIPTQKSDQLCQQLLKGMSTLPESASAATNQLKAKVCP